MEGHEMRFLITGHGGGCCGIRHARNFSLRDFSVSYVRKRLRELISAVPKGLLMEVVITDPQIRSFKYLPALLEEVGFEPVSRFTNGNSGNICNVYHYHKRRLPLKEIPRTPVPPPTTEFVWKSLEEAPLKISPRDGLSVQIRSSGGRSNVDGQIGRIYSVYNGKASLFGRYFSLKSLFYEAEVPITPKRKTKEVN